MILCCILTQYNPRILVKKYAASNPPGLIEKSKTCLPALRSDIQQHLELKVKKKKNAQLALYRLSGRNRGLDILNVIEIIPHKTARSENWRRLILQA